MGEINGVFQFNLFASREKCLFKAMRALQRENDTLCGDTNFSFFEETRRVRI